MMDIFIKVAGGISEGIDSPTRGEGRWCLNLARCLADAGHKVLMSCDGGYATWGRTQKYCNIEIIQWWLLNEIKHFKFDVYLTVNHIPGDPIPVQARVTLSGAYSLGGLMNEPLVSRVQDEVYTLAPGKDAHLRYTEGLKEKQVPWRNRYKLLCQPYGREFGKSKFKEKTILFSAKESFHPNLTRLHDDVRKNIFAAVDACKATGARFAAVGTEWNKKEEHKIIEDLGIFKKLKELDDSTIFPIIPWGDLVKVLSYSSVLLPLNFAGCTPDAIFMGMVPVLRSDSMLIWHPEYDMNGLVNEMGDTKNMTQDEIRDILIRLLTDEEYYNYFQGKIQQTMTDNLDDNVMKQFNDIIEYDNKERINKI